MRRPRGVGAPGGLWADQVATHSRLDFYLEIMYLFTFTLMCYYVTYILYFILQ